MEKICAVCGRKIEMRKKWVNTWDQIKYCGEKCRRSKKSTQYEDKILEILLQRGRDKTICPSEVLPDEEKSNKTLMELVRQSARRLVADGTIVMMQKGQVVDPSTAKGPIRLKLSKKGQPNE
jgi:hypothetical protein